jgi:hypothetical protein
MASDARRQPNAELVISRIAGDGRDADLLLWNPPLSLQPPVGSAASDHNRC